MKEIPGYPGYFATEQGVILTNRINPPKVLSASIHKGYLHVNVKTGLGRKSKKREPVHKLVLSAFHGSKPTPDHQCRHLNGDPFDNTPGNLAWGTAEENTQDAISHGTHPCLKRGEDHATSKLTKKKVLEIHALANDGVSLSLLSKQYGVHRTHISDIKLKRTWKHLWTPIGG